MSKESSSSDIIDYIYRPMSITPVISKVYREIVDGKLNNYFEGSSLLPHSQFSRRGVLKTCDALLKFSHHPQVALDRTMEGRFAQPNS